MTTLYLNWVLPHESEIIHATTATSADLGVERKIKALCDEVIVVPEPDAEGHTARRTRAGHERYCEQCTREFSLSSQESTVYYRLPREGFR